MTQRPNITVAAVVEKEGAFLFVEERAQGRLVINQPAGHLEAGESLRDAVIRETLEETGWEFVPQGLVGIYRWTSAQENKTYLRTCFFGQVGAHNPHRPLDTGIERTVWLTRAALAERAELLRSPLVARSVDDYLAGRRFPLNLLIDVD